MIEARELKYLNAFEYVGVLGYIVAFDEEDVTLDFGNDYSEIVKIKDLQPIQLTEEILLKCGFDDDFFMVYYTDLYKFTSDNKYLFVYELGSGNCYSINCQYLHTLQNLIYLISNKELEVKL